MPEPPPRRIDRLLFGSGRSISGTVYGTILAMSVIAATGATGPAEPWRLAGFVASSAVVFWLAHVYARARSTRASSRVVASTSVRSSGSRATRPRSRSPLCRRSSP